MFGDSGYKDVIPLGFGAKESGGRKDKIVRIGIRPIKGFIGFYSYCQNQDAQD
jgi:hypothetical protein